MAYTTPRTWVTSEVVTAAHMNQEVRDNVSFLANAPRCSVYSSAVQSIPTGTWTTLTFNQERWDTNAMHDNATNNSRITCITAGAYNIGATVKLASAASGDRGIRLLLNGTFPITEDERYMGATQTTSLSIATGGPFGLSAGDYVEVQVIQASGGAVDTVLVSYSSPEFRAGWASL